jgi:hypothetical protein
VAVLQLVEVDVCPVHVAEEVFETGWDSHDELASRLVPESVGVWNAARQVDKAPSSGVERLRAADHTVVAGEDVKALVSLMVDAERHRVAGGSGAVDYRESTSSLERTDQ